MSQRGLRQLSQPESEKAGWIESNMLSLFQDDAIISSVSRTILSAILPTPHLEVALQDKGPTVVGVMERECLWIKVFQS